MSVVRELTSLASKDLEVPCPNAKHMAKNKISIEDSNSIAKRICQLCIDSAIHSDRQIELDFHINIQKLAQSYTDTPLRLLHWPAINHA